MSGPRGRLRRVAALIRKESLQIIRDPSAYLIAGVLPLLLLLIFGLGVSLDLREVKLAVVVEEPTPDATSLCDAYRNSPYFVVAEARSSAQAEEDLVGGRIAGILVIRSDFSDRLGRGDAAPVQLLTDGGDPNTAGLVQGYAIGVWENWLRSQTSHEAGLVRRRGAALAVTAPRYWYNPTLDSRAGLLPGAVAINLTLIGTLLTALVVAREWERGTMESLLATPASRLEMLAGKVVPYFALGAAALVISVGSAVWLFGVPFRGSIGALALISSAYLVTMLTLGLLISTLTRNQFVASQAALIVGFLPAFELSGLVFEIDSMPTPIRMLTYLLPPRYYVSSLQTIFLAGDVSSVLVPNGLALCGFALAFFALLVRATRGTLE